MIRCLHCAARDIVFDNEKNRKLKKKNYMINYYIVMNESSC